MPPQLELLPNALNQFEANFSKEFGDKCNLSKMKSISPKFEFEIKKIFEIWPSDFTISVLTISMPETLSNLGRRRDTKILVLGLLALNSKQIWQNFLANTTKFLHPGTLFVTVWMKTLF